MTCDRDMMVLVSSYTDGETTPEESSRVKAHLESCGDCREFIEQWHRQRAMFEWAYTSEIPDDAPCTYDVVGKPEEMPTRRIKPFWQRIARPATGSVRRWRLAGALAAAVALGFVVYHFTILPPVLAVGKRLIAGSHPKVARIGYSIGIKVGPGSEIVRTGEKSIRLKKGWVSASVRHGSGLSVTAKRIQVTDLGTEFRVGTGSRMDYVVVREGSVSVSGHNDTRQVAAGQALFADDAGSPYVVSVPEDGPEDEEGALFARGGSSFEPSTAQSLDLTEGLHRLASEFPEARVSGSTVHGSSRVEAAEFRFGLTSMIGLKSGLRAHFDDIAQAIAGEEVQGGDWEIPVAVMQLSPVISTPQLPEDVYFVQLVHTSGRLVWRFTGSRGDQASYPFASDNRGIYGKSKSFTEGSVQSFSFESSTIRADNKPTTERLTVWLSDWPGRLKPTLSLTLGSVSIAGRLADEASVRSALAAYVGNVEPRGILCLDPERTSRFAWAWKADAGENLCRLSDMAKRGQGGSVVLGAFVTDTPLAQPKGPTGVYVIKFMLPSPQDRPHLEISQVGSSGGSIVLPSPVSPRNGGYSTQAKSLPGYGTMRFSLDPGQAQNGAYPFRISVIGRPIKHGNNVRYKISTEEWAAGCFTIKKP